MRAFGHCAVIMLAFGFSVRSALAGGVPGLKGLKCVTLQFALSKSSDPSDAKECGITELEVKDLMLVAVRSKIPRLAVREPCGCRLDLEVTLLPPFGGVQPVFATSLELYRQVKVLETQQNDYSIVWRGGGIAYSSVTDCRKVFRDTVEQNIQTFAAAYYQAGNP